MEETKEQKIANIIAELQPLFKEAEEKGLWFYCNYQNLWFSPEELRELHNNGKFIWGLPNWMLRNPNEKLTALRKNCANAEKEYEDFKNRLTK